MRFSDWYEYLLYVGASASATLGIARVPAEAARARAVAHHTPATFTGIPTTVPAVGMLVYFVCMCLLEYARLCVRTVDVTY